MKTIVVAVLVLLSVPAFAAKTFRCRNAVDGAEVEVVRFSISGDPANLSLENFSFSEKAGAAPTLVDSDVTDRFVSPGAVEIRAKKVTDQVQATAVVSLRGDYDLTRLSGSAVYVEQNGATKTNTRVVIDLVCR